jgi:hypothetical protein
MAWDYPLDGDDVDEEKFPTVAHSWELVETYTDSSKGRYKSYTNELDTLTFDLVSFLK